MCYGCLVAYSVLIICIWAMICRHSFGGQHWAATSEWGGLVKHSEYRKWCVRPTKIPGLSNDLCTSCAQHRNRRFQHHDFCSQSWLDICGLSCSWLPFHKINSVASIGATCIGLSRSLEHLVCAWQFALFFRLCPSHLLCISISGIYMVGNLGREKGVFWHCLLAAYITYPIRYIIYDESYWLSITLVVSALAFDHWSKEFDRAPRKRRSLKKRFFLLSTGLCIYLSVWLAFFYFNGKVSDGEGDEIPVHEAIHNFFASSWWTDIKQTVFDIYQYAQHHGWYEIYKQIIESLDVDGEQKAYKVKLNPFKHFQRFTC